VLFRSIEAVPNNMKLFCLSIGLLCTLIGFAQTNKRSKTPVDILYGPAETTKPHGPIISGILNMKATFDTLPKYPQKAKDLGIEGRVEVQLLVNEEGEVIFANPQSGPEALWAESVRAAVGARFTPLKLAGEPIKITGRTSSSTSRMGG